MDNYDSQTYGARIATRYDEWYQEVDPAAVALLAELAGEGPALELGIGTGRVALPLQQAGVEMHGIDASPAMVDQLRAKPGGNRIPVTFGDFAGVDVEGHFALIYVVFNSFFALLTQNEQIRCFANVARHLSSGGVFVIEVFVPNLKRFDGEQTMRAQNIGTDEIKLEVSKFDPVTQQVTSQHVLVSEGGIRLFPVKMRFAWPAELDLMARLAGLRLWYRWGDWQRTPFSGESKMHVSVYRHDG